MVLFLDMRVSTSLIPFFSVPLCHTVCNPSVYVLYLSDFFNVCNTWVTPHSVQQNCVAVSNNRTLAQLQSQSIYTGRNASSPVTALTSCQLHMCTVGLCYWHYRHRICNVIKIYKFPQSNTRVTLLYKWLLFSPLMTIVRSVHKNTNCPVRCFYEMVWGWSWRETLIAITITQ